MHRLLLLTVLFLLLVGVSLAGCTAAPVDDNRMMLERIGAVRAK